MSCRQPISGSRTVCPPTWSSVREQEVLGERGAQKRRGHSEMVGRAPRELPEFIQGCCIQNNSTETANNLNIKKRKSKWIMPKYKQDITPTLKVTW